MQWSSKPKIRIALLDDHTLIREALSVRLSAEHDFDVQGIYSTSTELLNAIRLKTFDLLVLDYQLSDGELDGLRLISLIRQRYPPALQIVIFSSAERSATVQMSIRAGAAGYVGKSQSTDDLIRAIRMAVRGQVCLSKRLTTEPKTVNMARSANNINNLVDYANLSPKEHEVLRCCLAGLTVTQIAQKFSRSRKTISAQKQSAFRKLGIVTDSELFKLQAELS
ncbi:two component transcriptional regulator, LuxR family [Vibrio sp. JCM 18904]|nr:two component transcriptional regulator, LuxR family [Vibrio sp. JCM 18904]